MLPSGHYDALLAHETARKRKQTKPKVKRFTDQLRTYVTTWLRKDLLPEQIRGRAIKDSIDCVSNERIYQYIWEDKRSKGDLHLHLRNKGRRYRKRGSAKDSRGIIRNRVDISERHGLKCILPGLIIPENEVLTKTLMGS